MSEAVSSLMEEEAASTATPRPEKKPFATYASFADYQNILLRTIMELTAAAGKLPSPGQEYDYYNSFPLFKRVMTAEGQSILGLMSLLTSQQTGKQNVFQMDGTDFDEKVELLTEINDILLERAGISLDVARGVKREQNEIQLATVSKKIDTIWNRRNEKFKKDSTASITLLTAKNVTRPQLSFPDKIDNSNSPFVPRIKEKLNALKPLAILVEKQEDGRDVFSHPYEVEIEAFQPTVEEMTPNVRDPLSVADTPLMMINSPEEVEEMMAHLRTQCSIAVDLEHHSFRSFQGFTCLIQISTWEKDFIVDALVLRAHLHVLNDVMTNPRIVKVLHGAASDVQWLQRDFGVYLVNLFDTGVAAKLLNFERLSLSFLLKHYMSVDADKRFQLVDWRIRPLPNEMVAYARGDTHYLLAIFERMKRDLVDASNAQGNLIRAAWERSSQICLRRYEKPLLDQDSHLQLMKASHKKLNDKQMYALKHIYAWRDRLAREQDESTGYVLPNHMLLHICELLPREVQGIIACCNPCPPLVKQQLNELHQIILRAREVQLTNPLLSAPKLDIPIPSSLHSIDMDNMLHVIHDIPQTHTQDEGHVRLPTLIDDTGYPIRNEDRPNTNKGTDIIAPRLARSKLFPHRDEKDYVTKYRLPLRLYVRAGPNGQIEQLRMITPYERYVKELERADRERESLNQMLQRAKQSAELSQPVEYPAASASTGKVQATEGEAKQQDDKSSDIDEKEDQDMEPAIIRGARKRKWQEPAIPFAGGEETSYKNTQSSKLEKRMKKKELQKIKRRQQTQPFDYGAAIQQQQEESQQTREQQKCHKGQQQSGPSGSHRRFHNHQQTQKRKQFDDMDELRKAESSRPAGRGRGGSPRGINKPRQGLKFRGGNRSMIVSRGRGQGGVSSTQWPSK
ncbi:exosome component 10-like [Tropilaelaps mercedesae]|uniref:Exosome complex component 10 homolog n=1 Tax=Tropilaelaps mercedesae TaxID=418985 RepID=A0A1V9XRJ1_9ACAR|nr:exosome component 10-like [Tropilaelaps mercedesae]